MESLKVNVEFSGGVELLFNKQKALSILIQDESFLNGGRTLKDFLPYMRDNYLTERSELFMSGDSIRPGILVLINDVDWDIEGGLDYILQHQDIITFISTLHGG